jgi:hypothetical protein
MYGCANAGAATSATPSIANNRKALFFIWILLGLNFDRAREPHEKFQLIVKRPIVTGVTSRTDRIGGGDLLKITIV